MKIQTVGPKAKRPQKNKNKIPTHPMTMPLVKRLLYLLLMLQLLLLVMLLHVIWRLCHSDAVPYVIQDGVVDWLADVLDRALLVGWSNDLVLTVERLVGGQNPDLSPGHLLLVDAHCLHNVVHLTLHLT